MRLINSGAAFLYFFGGALDLLPASLMALPLWEKSTLQESDCWPLSDSGARPPR